MSFFTLMNDNTSPTLNHTLFESDEHFTKQSTTKLVIEQDQLQRSELWVNEVVTGGLTWGT